MQDHVGEYAERNAASIAIAAGQPLREMREYAERSGISIPLLADEDWSAIRSYGVHHWFGMALHNVAYSIVRPATSIFGNPGRRLHRWTGLADNSLSKSIARPATFIIDQPGIIRYTYIGSNQYDLADQDEILDVLNSLAP